MCVNVDVLCVCVRVGVDVNACVGVLSGCGCEHVHKCQGCGCECIGMLCM